MNKPSITIEFAEDFSYARVRAEKIPHWDSHLLHVPRSANAGANPEDTTFDVIFNALTMSLMFSHNGHVKAAVLREIEEKRPDRPGGEE